MNLLFLFLQVKMFFGANNTLSNLERPFYPSKILAANLGDLFTQVKTALQLEATLPTEKKQPSNLERPFQRKKILPPIWSDLFTRVKTALQFITVNISSAIAIRDRLINQFATNQSSRSEKSFINNRREQKKNHITILKICE